MFNSEELLPALCVVGNRIVENKLSKYTLRSVGELTESPLDALNDILKVMLGGNIKAELSLNKSNLKGYDLYMYYGDTTRTSLCTSVVVKGDKVYMLNYTITEALHSDSLSVSDLLDELLENVADLETLQWVLNGIGLGVVDINLKNNLIYSNESEPHNVGIVFEKTLKGFKVKDILCIDVVKPFSLNKNIIVGSVSTITGNFIVLHRCSLSGYFNMIYTDFITNPNSKWLNISYTELDDTIEIAGVYNSYKYSFDKSKLIEINWNEYRDRLDKLVGAGTLHTELSL